METRLESAPLIRRVARRMQRVLEKRRIPPLRRRDANTAVCFPEPDVFERDSRLIVRLGAPGLKKYHLLVHANPTELTIFSERTYAIGEPFSYRSFHRTIPLPPGAHFWSAKTRFDNGILEVTIPLPVATDAFPARKVAIEHSTEKKTTKTAA